MGFQRESESSLGHGGVGESRNAPLTGGCRGAITLTSGFQGGRDSPLIFLKGSMGAGRAKSPASG